MFVKKLFYLCCLVFRVRGDNQPDENVEKLLKFKSDLDDIGTGVEMLAFDVASEVVRKITTENPTKILLDSLAKNQANNFMLMANENAAKTLLEPLTENPLNNLLRATNQNAAIDTLVKQSSANEDVTNDLIRSFSQNAAKLIQASASNNNANGIPNETQLKLATDSLNKMFTEFNESLSKSSDKRRSKRDAPLTDTPIVINVPINGHIKPTSNNVRPNQMNSKVDNEGCKAKTLQEEQDQINQMNEEIQNLHDIIVLLRDQQKTITLLDKENENFPSRFNAKDLLKILHHFDMSTELERDRKPDSINDILDTDAKRPSSHQTMEDTIQNLKSVVNLLNKTKEVTVNAREREVILENEVMHQGIELNILKTLIEKLVKTESGDAILGATPHLPKELPKKTRGSEIEKQNPNQARTSETEEDLLKLLTDDQNDVTKKTIDENNKTESIKDLLKKLILRLKNNKVKKVDKAELIAKLMNKPESKTGDDIDLELIKLKDAIDNLKPKDDFDNTELSDLDKVRILLNRVDNFDSEEISDTERLRILLNRLQGPGGRNLNFQPFPKTQNVQHIKQKQIEELRKKLDKLESNLNNDDQDLVRPSTFNAHQYPIGPYSPNMYPQLHTPPYDVNDKRPMPYPCFPGNNWYRPYEDMFSHPQPSLPSGQYANDRNQFFRGPPNDIEPPHDQYPTENAFGNSQDQPGPYPPQNNEAGEYQKPTEEVQIVANLEGQINELREIIRHLNQGPQLPQTAPTYVKDEVPPSLPPRPKSDTHSFAKRSINDNEIVSKSKSDPQLVEQIATMIKDVLFEDDVPKQRSSYDDLEDEISVLKTQLEGHLGNNYGRDYQHDPYRSVHSSYYHPYYPSFLKNDKFDLIKTKKNTIFNSIVLKIVDKILGVIPLVLERIFGQSLYELINFNSNNGYGYSNGYSVDYNSKGDVQNLFKSLGFLGYGPLVFIKIIDGFTTIINILKKNKFFKNFLIPTLMLLLVAGAVIFLVWWMQPDDYQPTPQGIEYYPQQTNYVGDHNYLNKPHDRYSKNRYNSYNVHYNPYNTHTNDRHNQGYSRSYLETTRSAHHWQ